MRFQGDQCLAAQTAVSIGAVEDVDAVEVEIEDESNATFAHRKGGQGKSPNRLMLMLASMMTPRAYPEFRVPEALSLFGFCSLLAWCIPHHESWFDEAQAWLIARDSSLADLIVHRLHYEGSPALWHLLLWLEYRSHVSLLGMHMVAGAIAASGMFVWLRFNPLPRLISLLLPFTFFFQYQYAVVARSYTLCPLLALALMALYQCRSSHPLWFAAIAGLLANCSLHMAALSAGLVLLYAADRMSSWSAMHGRERWGLAGSALVLFAFFAVSAATAMPTADGSSTTANPIVGSIRKALAGTAHAPMVRAQSADWVSTGEAQSQAPQQGLIATRVWYLIHPGPGAAPKALLVGGIIKHLLVLLTAITVPISTSNLLAIGYLMLLILNLARAKLLISLLPYAFIQVCNVLISGEAHHLGLLWIALVCSLWILSLHPMPVIGRWRRSRFMLFGATLLIVLLQIQWSLHALRSDVNRPYSSSEATASFLKSLPKSERVAAFDDDSVTVNAYLDRSPYFNQKVDYWPFSRTADPSLTLEQTMALRPDVVVLKMASPDSPITNQWVILNAPGTVFVLQAPLRLLLVDNYRETHRFCGQRFFRNSSESTDCRLIFEPAAKPSHDEVFANSRSGP